MKILYLREVFRQMHPHSGYDPLCAAVSAALGQVVRSTHGRHLNARLRGWRHWVAMEAMKRSYGGSGYQETSAWGELMALLQAKRHTVDLIHIMAAEGNYGLLRFARRLTGARVIATAHQTRGWWRYWDVCLDNIQKLDGLVVLSRDQVADFEPLLGDRVRFIPLGVDTNVFCPGVCAPSAGAPRVVFSGLWMRDLDTLARVVDEVIRQAPETEFHIVPGRRVDDSRFVRMGRHKQVFWHFDLSTADLCALYRTASVMFLPLLDAAANTALVEALACGLPVVVTDVPGVHDYSRPEFASIVPVGDATACAQALLDLVHDRARAAERGQCARRFAVAELAWPVVARQTISFYHEVLGNN